MTEVLMLLQTLILLGTGVVVAFYTLETRKMRAVASAQFNIMQQTLQLQLAEEKRAAEPVFVWGGGSGSPHHLEWQFTNEGGPISHLTITMRSPDGAQTGVEARIRPREWWATHGQGAVTVEGNVASQFEFTIGFQTRLGSVGGFFFSASRESQPALTGSEGSG